MKSLLDKKKKKYSVEKDGITQGLLQTWMSCRYKARFFLDGWRTVDTRMALIFGSLIHGINEAVYKKVRKGKTKHPPSTKKIKSITNKASKIWIKDNPRASKRAREMLAESVMIANILMPLYFERWEKDDFKEAVWQEVEGKFNLPVKLKDGRRTRFRGMIDGSFLSKGLNKLWLFETKTGTRINPLNLTDRLAFDLQVGFYLNALYKLKEAIPEGFLYNNIRRPELRIRKKESLKQFADRMENDIQKRPDWYFVRLPISISKKEFKAIRKQLFVIVREFYDWYEGKLGHYRCSGQCEGKYGRCGYLTMCANGGKPTPIYVNSGFSYRELD